MRKKGRLHAVLREIAIGAYGEREDEDEDDTVDDDDGSDGCEDSDGI